MDKKQTIEEYRIILLERPYDKLNDKVDTSINKMTEAFADLRVDNSNFQTKIVEELSKTRNDINKEMLTQTRWIIGIFVTIVLAVLVVPFLGWTKYFYK